MPAGQAAEDGSTGSGPRRSRPPGPPRAGSCRHGWRSRRCALPQPGEHVEHPGVGEIDDDHAGPRAATAWPGRRGRPRTGRLTPAAWLAISTRERSMRSGHRAATSHGVRVRRGDPANIGTSVPRAVPAPVDVAAVAADPLSITQPVKIGVPARRLQLEQRLVGQRARRWPAEANSRASAPGPDRSS